MKYLVLAKYLSKYGLILYVTIVKDDAAAAAVDMDNVYINTLYFKGAAELAVGQIYELQTVKGENGLTYAFL